MRKQISLRLALCVAGTCICIFVLGTAFWFHTSHIKKDTQESSVLAYIDVYQDMMTSVQIEDTDPRLVKYVKQRVLYGPSDRQTHKYAKNRDFSQNGQSRVVDKLLNKRTGGFFVECGAWDGVKNSNSLFFETSRNWTGLLVEPDPRNFDTLAGNNRKAYIAHTCLTGKPEPVEFTLSKSLDSGALRPINPRIALVGKMKILCFPIQTLLAAMGRTHVDYFSLDVEGVELQVLKAFPWDEITVDVWTIEVHTLSKNYTGLAGDIRKVFLDTGAYREVKPVGQDFVFVRRDIK